MENINRGVFKLKAGLLIALGAVCLVFIVWFALSASHPEKNANIEKAAANNNLNAAKVKNANSTDTNTASQTNTNQADANTSVNTNASSKTNANANAKTNASQNIVTTAKTIDSVAVKFTKKTTGHCEALAPADWGFITNAEGSGADLYSPDRALHAGWGISAVYTYMYPTVDSFLNAWLGYAYTGSFTEGSITLGATQDVYEGFVQREFTTANGRKGVTIYKTYNFGDPTLYVVSVYIADTAQAKWASTGATPFSVALTIRCVTQLRPVTSSVDVSSSDPSLSSDNPEVSLSDQWTEAIMGYENVYSPSTGDHYEAPLTSKWETGPEGSGYYRSQPGGGYEKLERGFGDY